MLFLILTAILFGGMAIVAFILGGVGKYKLFEESGYLNKEDEKKLKKTSTLWLVFGVVFTLLFIMVPWNFHQVDTGEVAVIRTLGKVEGTRDAGVHFDFWLTTKYEKFDTKVRSVESNTMTYSKDKQTMTIQMTVQYKIDTAHVENIAKTYGSLEVLESRINSVVIERTKSTMAEYNADEIISERASVSSAVSLMVSDALSNGYFVEVTNIALTDIDFSDAYEESVEQSMIAKQEVERAKAEAEKLLVEAQNKIKIAEAEAAAAKAKAEGEAEAKRIEAQAEADALALIEAAWEAVAPEVREIMLREMGIEKWDGKLPDTMVGSDFIEQLLGALK